MRFKYDYQHMSNHLDIKCKICFTKFVKYFLQKWRTTWKITFMTDERH